MCSWPSHQSPKCIFHRPWESSMPAQASDSNVSSFHPTPSLAWPHAGPFGPCSCARDWWAAVCLWRWLWHTMLLREIIAHPIPSIHVMPLKTNCLNANILLGRCWIRWYIFKQDVLHTCAVLCSQITVKSSASQITPEARRSISARITAILHEGFGIHPERTTTVRDEEIVTGGTHETRLQPAEWNPVYTSI